MWVETATSSSGFHLGHVLCQWANECQHFKFTPGASSMLPLAHTLIFSTAVFYDPHFYFLLTILNDVQIHHISIVDHTSADQIFFRTV